MPSHSVVTGGWGRGRGLFDSWYFPFLKLFRSRRSVPPPLPPPVCRISPLPLPFPTAQFLIDGVLGGFNASVFAYGATGAGKTFTMLGAPDEPGIMILTLRDLFRKIKELAAKGITATVCVALCVLGRLSVRVCGCVCILMHLCVETAS